MVISNYLEADVFLFVCFSSLQDFLICRPLASYQ